MIDYKAKPFYLTDEQIRWVEDTYEAMSHKERIGQLFCPIVFTKDKEQLEKLVHARHIGGVLYRE